MHGNRHGADEVTVLSGQLFLRVLLKLSFIHENDDDDGVGDDDNDDDADADDDVDDEDHEGNVYA